MVSLDEAVLSNENRVSCSIKQRRTVITPGRRQSKTLITIDELGSENARNSVFDCHLSLIGRQMAIENSVSNDF